MTRLLYVLSASHSGSTLLSMLLNAHPDVVTAGELKAEHFGDPDHYRCSCHALLKECAFWRAVADCMHSRGHEFSIIDAKTHFGSMDSGWVRRLLRPLVRDALTERVRDAVLAFSPVWRRGLPRMLRRSADLVHCVAEVAHAKVVVESSKVGLRLKYLARCADLDITVIRLIRDGRAVALTYMRPDEFADARDAKLRGGGTGVNRDTRLSMDDAAREWRRSNEEAEALLQQLPGLRVIQVRYEDLCNAPVDTVNLIFGELGLDTITSLTGFRSLPHHVIGNGMRLDTDNRVELDDRWRNALVATELSTFNRVAGDLNSRYGYQ
jgi:Sulfotransferase family